MDSGFAMSAHFDNQWRGGMKPFLLNESHADVHFLVGIDDVKVRNCMLFIGKAYRGLGATSGT